MSYSRSSIEVGQTRFPAIGEKYKYQGRERHGEIGETETVRVNTLVQGNSLCVATWRVICSFI